MYDQAPAEIAKAIFKEQGRMAKEKLLADCPVEKVKQVRHCLNIFIERRRLCRVFGWEFWT